jgi:hypothetical protein
MFDDLKEIVGTLMKALAGEMISRADVEDLYFDADGELRIALNEAYAKLLEYAHDCEEGVEGQHALRGELQQCLNRIVAVRAS